MSRGLLREFALHVCRDRLERRSVELAPDELAKSALVVAPHPDDETLGCGGTIIRKRQAGAEVKVLILSDGRHSHPGIAPDELKTIRCREAREACRTLGLADTDIDFGDFEDQSLTLELEAATRKIEETLRRDRPRQVFLPLRFEQPEDHSATYRAGAQAIERVGLDVVCYEYPIWFWDHWPWSPLQTRHPLRMMNAAGLTGASSLRLLRNLRVKVAISDVLEQKRDALRRYGSQMERPRDDPSWPILEDVAEGEFLSHFLASYEYFGRTVFDSSGA